MVNHHLFGPVVRDGRGGFGFSPKLKAISIFGIVATFTVTLTFVIKTALGRALMIALALALIVYILRLPTKRADLE